MQVTSKIKLLFIYAMLKVKVQPKLKVDTFRLVAVFHSCSLRNRL